MAHLKKVGTAAYRLLALFDQSFTGPLTNDAATLQLEELLKQEVVLAEGPDGEIIPLEPEAAPPNGSSLLLVVDDVEANRDILTRRLTRDGYAVATAVNGREAVDMLEAGSYDLVLCDIMMPEMDGYEVLERMKADDRLRHVPIIMISALTEIDAAARCIELGAEDYLPKPFNPTLLKARITASLERRRAHQREAVLVEKLQASLRKSPPAEGA